MKDRQKYPKISIITPSYNQGQYIEETILSVINQNYPNLEYIIIDGGSTDNSVEIIKKYEKYLSYWVSEPDGGMYEAIQKGFDKSTGELMTWLNSDDLLFQDALFIISNIFERYEQVEWLGGCAAQIDEQNRIINIHQQKQWNKYKYYLLDYKYIQQEGTFWRRNVWEKSGASLNIEAKLAGDLELWLRFFQHAEYYTLSLPLGLFRISSSNQKSLESLDNYHREAERFILSYEFNSYEKKQIKKYHFYKNYIEKIPFIRSLSFFRKPYESLDIFKFLKRFYFDQKEQILMLSE